MRTLTNTELLQVSGGDHTSEPTPKSGNAYGHSNPNNPKFQGNATGPAPAGTPNGIAKKYNQPGDPA